MKTTGEGKSATKPARKGASTSEGGPPASGAGYAAGAVAQILELTEARLRSWAGSGLCSPSFTQGGKPLYTFPDLVAVKATKELTERGFSPPQIRRALLAVRAQLPGVDRPLDRLRVAWNGAALVILDDGAAFELTGQRVFDFGLGELQARAASLTTSALGKRRPPVASGKSGFDWLRQGLEAERAGRDADALACYRSALEADPGLAAAQTNLGALAHRRGELAEARARFEEALAIDPEQAEARYNLATLLYETGEIELAAAELRHVLELRPDFADAHYNLATALERLGGRLQARTHLVRFLDLLGEPDDAATCAWADEARARLARLA